MRQTFLIVALLIVFLLTAPVIFNRYSKAFIKQERTAFITDYNALGNKLVSYFYSINTNTNNHLREIHLQHINQASDTELYDFYRQWKWEPRTKKIEYNSEAVAAWHSVNDDGSAKNNYLEFWQTVRPQTKSLYNIGIEDPGVVMPVVHFRCSDSPFNKHRQYHLTKASTVQWMAEKIRERGYSQVILLNCNQHHSQDRNSCAKYAGYYSKIFNDYGITVNEQCNSLINDFALMVYTPLLISLNSSSLSFIAGIAKDPRDYISCNMGVEQASGNYVLQSKADWILSVEAPLLHVQVPDYNDAEDVINKLG